MDELAKRFAALADKYGPDAVEAARDAARVEAYSSITEALIAGLIALAFLLSGRYLWRKAKDEESWDSEPLYFLGGAAFVCCAVAFSIGAWNVIDPWTWTAIYHPDVWIAKRTLGL